MQGWRKKMEDTHINIVELPKGDTIFGVFDGHGGSEVAKFVKKNFTRELIENKNFSEGEIEKALIENYLRMDELLSDPSGMAELKQEAKLSSIEEKVNDLTSKHVRMFKNMYDPRHLDDVNLAMFTGCTACVCLVNKEESFFANAGDSRAVVFRKGVAEAVTNDHKPDNEKEKERIIKAQGWISQGRVKGNLNLSRSIGDLAYKDNKYLRPEEKIITSYPDVCKIENKDVDFIVIACDGIWDCKKNQQVCDFVWERLKTKPECKLSDLIAELFEEIIATDTPIGKFIFNFKTQDMVVII